MDALQKALYHVRNLFHKYAQVRNFKVLKNFSDDVKEKAQDLRNLNEVKSIISFLKILIFLVFFKKKYNCSYFNFFFLNFNF